MNRSESVANVALASSPDALECARWRAVLGDGGKPYTHKPSRAQAPKAGRLGDWVRVAVTVAFFAAVGVVLASF